MSAFRDKNCLDIWPGISVLKQGTIAPVAARRPFFLPIRFLRVHVVTDLPCKPILIQPFASQQSTDLFARRFRVQARKPLTFRIGRDYNQRNLASLD